MQKFNSTLTKSCLQIKGFYGLVFLWNMLLCTFIFPVRLEKCLWFLKAFFVTVLFTLSLRACNNVAYRSDINLSLYLF